MDLRAYESKPVFTVEFLLFKSADDLRFSIEYMSFEDVVAVLINHLYFSDPVTIRNSDSNMNFENFIFINSFNKIFKSFFG